MNSPLLQLTLEVSTHARSGLLLWQGAGDSFLAITLADGHAVLNVAHTQVQVLGRSIREESSVEREYIANIMLALSNNTATYRKTYVAVAFSSFDHFSTSSDSVTGRGTRSWL